MNHKTRTKTPVMSSRDIAEITGKPHKSVFLDIEEMLMELDEDVEDFLGAYLDEDNQHRVEFFLDSEMTDQLITSYIDSMEHNINQRWGEIEKAQHHNRVPVTLEHALAAMSIIAKSLNMSEEDKTKMMIRTVEIFDEDLARALQVNIPNA